LGDREYLQTAEALGGRK